MEIQTNDFVESLMTPTNLDTEDTNEMGKEAFLEMFTTQLKHQDPLNPMDNTEFTAQLATFTSLEQLFNMNENMEQMLQYENSLNNVLAVSMIGKEVTTEESAGAVITGITFEEGVTFLTLDNGEKVTMSELTGIFEKSSEDA